MKKRIMALLTAGVLFTGLFAGVGSFVFADELDDAEKEKQRLEERKEEAQKGILGLVGRGFKTGDRIDPAKVKEFMDIVHSKY